VANVTNIKTDHIRALESGDWDAFGAQVYIRGFTRTYAKELRLDVPRIMSELETELGQTEDYSAPPPLTDGFLQTALPTTAFIQLADAWIVFPILLGLGALLAASSAYVAISRYLRV